MKFGELFGKQAKKLGIDITTDEFKPLLAIDIDVPETIATQIDNGLLTLEAAKSNDVLNKFFRQTHLGIADKRIAEFMTENGIDPDDDFTATTNTYDKITKLGKLAKAAGEKKKGAAGTGDAAEWAKKEAEYNRQLVEAKKQLTEKDQAWTAKMQEQGTSFAMQKKLIGKNYIFPKEMDMELQLQTALSAINTDLAKNGFRMIIDETGTQRIVNKDGQPAYSADHVAIEPDTYFDAVLTRNKLLKVNDTGNSGGGGNGQQNNNGSTFVPDTTNKANAAVALELMNQAKTLAD